MTPNAKSGPNHQNTCQPVDSARSAATSGSVIVSAPSSHQ
ncbi:Uncharacterised protein [Burkholderia pseudomallei]|nr:Uncharacterised protein [Burkholderia pseudomallei]